MITFNKKLLPTSAPVVLAIDPGTRELGYAVLEGRELIYYGVKTVVDRRRPSLVLETASAFIKQLMADYRPNYLAIEKMFVTQKNTALLTVVAAEIKAVALEALIDWHEYAPTTIRQRLCQSGRATKRDVARLITDSYPELDRYYRRTRKWEQDYFANLFDAIAVGLVCLGDLQPGDAGSETNLIAAQSGAKSYKNLKLD